MYLYVCTSFYLHLCGKIKLVIFELILSFSFIFKKKGFSCAKGIASSVRGEGKYDPRLKTNFDLLNLKFPKFKIWQFGASSGRVIGFNILLY